MSVGLQIFTIFHVILSLIGIATGLVVLFAFIAARPLNGWNTWFLWTTIATSVTGYMFPFHKLLPSHIVGALSLRIFSRALRTRECLNHLRKTTAPN